MGNAPPVYDDIATGLTLPPAAMPSLLAPQCILHDLSHVVYDHRTSVHDELDLDGISMPSLVRCTRITVINVTSIILTMASLPFCRRQVGKCSAPALLLMHLMLFPPVSDATPAIKHHSINDATPAITFIAPPAIGTHALNGDVEASRTNVRPKQTSPPSHKKLPALSSAQSNW